MTELKADETSIATSLERAAKWMRRWQEANALGFSLLDLVDDQASWSQATFGTDAERGPAGALAHLEKEAREAQAAAVEHYHARQMDRPVVDEAYAELKTELADCLLLLLDASRRAGLSPLDLICAAVAKMVVNKARQWPKPVGDTPVEHVKPELGGEG